MQRIRRAPAKRQTWNSHSPEPRGGPKHIDHGQQGYWGSDSHVGQILTEKTVFHHGPHALVLNWYKAEFRDSLGPHYWNQSFLSDQEQTRVKRDIACDYQVTPMGYSSPKESKWTSLRDSKWALSPREPGLLRGRAWHHDSRVSCPLQTVPSRNMPLLVNQNMLSQHSW